MLHILFDMPDLPLDAELPSLGDQAWHPVIDTRRGSLEDIREPEARTAVDSPRYRIEARSVVVLEAR